MNRLCDAFNNTFTTLLQETQTEQTFIHGDVSYNSVNSHNAARCITSVVYTGQSYSKNVELTWNSQYQLTAVSTNGVEGERNGYDPMGRRVWNWDGTTTNFFVWSGADLIAEVDSTGGLRRAYVYAGLDMPLAMTVYTGATPVTYFYLTNKMGTVHAVADETGNIVEQYRLDAWGRVLGVYDGDAQPLTESAIGNRLLAQGREYSWKTGFYYHRARWMDPTVGRWLSPDAIGIAGGLNLWEYAGNCPTMYSDPFGLDAYMIQEGHTTYWTVDTPNGGVEMYHYSGQSWNRGSGQWRVFWSDQAEISQYTDPSAFLQTYHPDMPKTADSIRKLADNRFMNQRFKTTCDEDKQILQKFRDAYQNQDKLRYNAFGIGNPNCDSFGGRILIDVIGRFRWLTGMGK